MSLFDQSRGQGFVVDWEAPYGGVGKPVASCRKADVHIFKSGEGTFRAWAMLRSVPFRTRLSIPVTKCPSERQRSVRWLPEKAHIVIDKGLGMGRHFFEGCWRILWRGWMKCGFSKLSFCLFGR